MVEDKKGKDLEEKLDTEIEFEVSEIGEELEQNDFFEDSKKNKKKNELVSLILEEEPSSEKDSENLEEKLPKDKVNKKKENPYNGSPTVGDYSNLEKNNYSVNLNYEHAIKNEDLERVSDLQKYSDIGKIDKSYFNLSSEEKDNRNANNYTPLRKKEVGRRGY